MPASIPVSESARLATLNAYQILDTPPEAAFDRIASLACRVLGVPIAAVSFVDRDRQWFKASVGLPICESARDISFCAHAILEEDIFVVPDAAADARFAQNPFVTDGVQVRFYAGAPLRTSDDHALGTLCVIDDKPRSFSEYERGVLKDLAAMVVDELVLRTQHEELKSLHASVENRVAARTLELTEVNEALSTEIRERAFADEQCQRSEQRFRQLFNQAGDAAVVHELDGQIVDVNEAASTLLGYTRAEMLSLEVADILTTFTPEALHAWRDLPVGYSAKVERVLRRKDGTTFPAEVHASVLATPGARQILTLTRDITERRRSEELLRVRARNQEAIARLGTRALSGGNEGALLEQAVALVGETLGVERCRVHEHLAERNEFVVRASLDPDDPGVGVVSSDDKASSVPGFVLHTAEPIIVEDVDNDHRFESFGTLRAYGARSALCVLIGGTDPGDLRFGVLGVATRRRRTFTEEDVFFVQTVANTLAAAIVRRRREDELHAMEARYRRIAANTSGVVFQLVMKPDFSVTMPFVSEGCRQVYGMEPAQLQAAPESLHRVVHPVDKENYKRVLRASVATLDPFNWEGRVVLPSGALRWVASRARLQRQPNGDVMWDGLVLDVTELKEAQETMVAAKEEAEKANAAKNEFLSRMSHELRTPLNAILGFGQVLQMGELAAQDTKCVEYILNGGRHLLSLVDEVLDISRAEAGQLHLVFAPLEVSALAQECVDLLAPLAAERRIICEVASSCRQTLWCDEQRLRQMLLNLLSNAIKYNREGGRVTIECEAASTDRVRVKVIDTGEGLLPEAIARLFVPFERLEQQYGRVEGTGLGLVVSRRIAEAMNGDLGVESTVGRGSTFWIELPLGAMPANSSVNRTPAADALTTRMHTASSVKLLYIEDNLSNLQVVQMMLARQRPHWEFTPALEGSKGLEQARTALPDLIFLDLQLPGISGEEVLIELRNDPLTRNIPVVVLSADATPSSRERLLSKGADDYLSKPFQIDSLLNLSDQILSKQLA